MRLLIKFFCLWGLFDAVLLATRPKVWGRFWDKGVILISETPQLPKVVAALQFGLCYWMLGKASEKKHRCKK